MRTVVMRSLAILSATLLAAGVAACSDEAPVQPVEPMPASIADLTGPWRPTPLLLDSATWSRIERACITDMQVPPGSRASLIDVRGAGVATVLLAGNNAGACDALRLTPAGQVEGAGGGRWGGAAPDRPRAGRLGALEATIVEGGELTMRGWSMSGRAGPGIALVTIEWLGCPVTTATLIDGWFASWCPIPGNPDAAIDVQRLPVVVIRGYDAFGNMLDELKR